MSATEWIQDWLKDGDEDDLFLVRRLRELGYTDESTKAFIESFT